MDKKNFFDSKRCARPSRHRIYNRALDICERDRKKRYFRYLGSVPSSEPKFHYVEIICEWIPLETESIGYTAAVMKLKRAKRSAKASNQLESVSAHDRKINWTYQLPKKENF